MSEKRGRWFWWLLLAAVIAAILYARCGLGLGLGLGGSGDDPREQEPSPQPLATPVAAPSPDAAAPRCQVRVDAAGVSLAGSLVEVDRIASRCPSGVELTVTGDARYGDAEAVRAAVRDAGLELLDRSR